MTVNELVSTVSTNSACLYEIRCPKRGLIYNRRGLYVLTDEI